ARTVHCVHCGEQYLYDVRRDAAACQSTCSFADPGAAQRASDQAHQEVALQLREAVDLVPCPTCGGYQPDLLTVMKRRFLRWMVWPGVPALLAGLVLGGVLTGRGEVAEGPLYLAGGLGGVGVALLLLRTCLTVLYNPNGGNPEKRRQLGR